MAHRKRGQVKDGTDGLASAVWRKSSLSMSNGDCVEVADLARDLIRVRDSKDAEGLMLRSGVAFAGRVDTVEYVTYLSYSFPSRS